MVIHCGLCLSVLTDHVFQQEPRPPPPSRSHRNRNSLKLHKPQTPLPDFLLTTSRLAEDIHIQFNSAHPHVRAHRPLRCSLPCSAWCRGAALTAAAQPPSLPTKDTTKVERSLVPVRSLSGTGASIPACPPALPFCWLQLDLFPLKSS